jgi:hypothetical protein
MQTQFDNTIRPLSSFRHMFLDVVPPAIQLIKPSIAFLLAALSFSILAPAKQPQEDFSQGCCRNPAFKPPETVSHSTVETRVLEEALNCATNNRSVGGPAQLATLLGGRSSLNVSYFYGKYMPQQDAEMVTVAVYSENDRRGYLFDMSFDGGKYFIANLPQLRKSKKQWQVGEINGGMWSFTRLWYLAQEIGARPRQRVAISEILRAAPRSCKAMNE